MRPHYSQSNRENATPFSGTSPLASYNERNVNPILVTFGQICNFRDLSLVTFYFYELKHFLDLMKNTLLFIYITNIKNPF